MRPSRGTPDFLLLFLTLGMVGFGIVMVFSASFTVSYWDMGNRWYFTQRQIIWAVMGTIMMFITMNIPFQVYKKHFLLILFFAFFLLILVFVPGIGVERNGAVSWIGFKFFSIQPAEFAKLGLIIYLSALISKKNQKMITFKQGLFPTLFVTLIFFILIALQPDYGTAMILLATAGIIIFVGGAKIKYLLYLLFIGITILPVFILTASYRLSRITSYLDPWSDPYGSGYQLIQSLIALGNGEIFGAGFGKGIQKYFYLPYPQSDFIFSVIGEELGFVGVTIFIILFLVFIWKIVLISLRSKDPFGTLMGIGIASSLAIQAFVNIGGVTGTIPITGVPLPLISTGGSSLVMSMIEVGIILNISKNNDKGA